MNDHEEGEDKPEQPLESHPDVQVVLHVLEHFVALFKNFKDFQKPRNLHQFVHFADPCDPHNLIQVISSKKGVKGNNCKKVDGKPTFNVQLCNDFSVLNLLELFIIVSGVEDEDDVDEKGKVDEIVQVLPTRGVLFD